MNCPICNRRRLFRRWEQSRSNWWTGKYECPRCGIIKCTGLVTKDNRKTLTYWHPACVRCGLDPVVRLHDMKDTFTCTGCGARLTAHEGVLSRHFRGTRKDGPTVDHHPMWDGIAESAAMRPSTL